MAIHTQKSRSRRKEKNEESYDIQFEGDDTQLNSHC